MTKAVVLGATGRIAHHAVQMLADKPDVEQTLFVRDGGRLTDVPTNARVAEGDVLDRAPRRGDAWPGRRLRQPRR